VPKSASLIFVALAIASYIIGAVLAEVVYRRNLRRTGFGGGTLYVRLAALLVAILFLLCGLLTALARVRRQ
jgi:hypothetical protein